MHRTQIYLPDSLHIKLRVRAKNSGISVSELIRRTLVQEIDSDPPLEAETFFERLKPLASFTERVQSEKSAAMPSPEAYVRSLRKNSRILNPHQNAVE